MPPKRLAPVSEDPPEEKVEKKEGKADAATVRKMSTHPTTAIMVREALKDLDSRKGVSSQAIQSYIKQKYPSVDLMRVKHLVRRALKNGIETGTLVRPANSNVSTGAAGKFRLAPKVKAPKPKTENVDPNVPKATKTAKDAPKTKRPGSTKKKDVTNEEPESEHSKETKKQTGDEEASTSKAAPPKKPKAKKAAGPVKEGATDAAKSKVKTVEEKKVGKGKPVADGDLTATKTTGRRAKKSAE